MAQQEPIRDEYRVYYQLRRYRGDEEFDEIGFGNTLGYNSIDDAVAEAVSSMTENGITQNRRARHHREEE